MTFIFVLTWSCDVLSVYACIIWPCDVQISMIVLFKHWYCITNPFHPGPSAGSHFFHQKLDRPRFRLENVNHRFGICPVSHSRPWLIIIFSHSCTCLTGILDGRYRCRIYASHITRLFWNAKRITLRHYVKTLQTQTTFRDSFKTVKLLSSFQIYLVYCDIKLKRIRLYPNHFAFCF